MPPCSMSKDDAIRIRHMLDAVQEALGFCASRTRNDLDRDRQLLLALVKDLEILGEAASRVSADTQRQWNRIPWAEIIAMRHRLIHGYFDIDVDIVWSTLQEDLPPLVAHLRDALVMPPDDPLSSNPPPETSR
jgi:uncharacterized protein with HEPN domain